MASEGPHWRGRGYAGKKSLGRGQGVTALERQRRSGGGAKEESAETAVGRVQGRGLIGETAEGEELETAPWAGPPKLGAG